MRQVVVSLVVVTTLLLAAGTEQACAEAPGRAAPKACTPRLPAALQALGTSADQILDERQAEQIRGQWWVYLPITNGSILDPQGNAIPITTGAVYFQGVGSPFTLNVQSWSSANSRPVSLRITIGR